MVRSVNVIGRGRVGSAVATRLEERGIALREDAELVLLCVPDGAIAGAASGLEPGPWVAHVSGATPLGALDPHERRFSVHPLQTFTRTRGPEQLDGAWAAVSAEMAEALALGFDFARALGLEPFELDDGARPLYHAGAVVASNYLVTLHEAAAGLVAAAGATRAADAAHDRERLRADGADRARRLGYRRDAPSRDSRGAAGPRAALRRSRRGNGPMRIARTAAELPPEGEIGLVPTMGAFHDGHLALFRVARAENDVVVASLFVNPAQFGEGEDLGVYPRDEERDARVAERAGVDVLFVPRAEEMYPPGFQTWVDVEHLGAVLEGEHRPRHFRGVATICLKLFNLVRPRRAYFGQKDAQQVAVVRRLVRDLAVPVEVRAVPTVRDDDGLALSSRNGFLSPPERERALALPRALAARDRSLLEGVDVDYFEEADFEPRVLAAAVRVGTTRLIDNVVLEGDPR